VEHAVLGDLAEAWADCANSNGVREANRWYWRQAIMTAPYLLLACWRDTRSGGALGMAKPVGAGFVAMAVLSSFGDGLFEAVFRSAPEKLSIAAIVTRFVIGAAIGLGSGATSARVSRTIPLVSAVALAVAYLGLAALAAFTVGATVSITYWASLSMIIPGAFIVGRMPRSAGAVERSRSGG
jgi:hypothetical protein